MYTSSTLLFSSMGEVGFMDESLSNSANYPKLTNKIIGGYCHFVL
jgi:hypothetical protein